MLPRIDTESIKVNVDLAAVVNRDVDLHFVGHGGELRGPCPFCEDGTDRFAIFPNTGLFNCRVCGRKGDVIDYIQAREGLDFIPAAKHLMSVEIPATPLENRPTRQENGSQGAFDRGAWRDDLSSVVNDSHLRLSARTGEPAKAVADWLARRGVTMKAVNAYSVGINDHWRTIEGGVKVYPGITLPQYGDDLEGVNVYLSGQVSKPASRRRWVAGSQPKAGFFGGQWLGKSGPVVIVEGELDCMVLARFLLSSGLLCVATGGSGMVPDDLATFQGRRLIVVPDNDRAGELFAERWKEKGALLIRVPDGHKDVTDYWRAGQIDFEKWIANEFS